MKVTLDWLNEYVKIDDLTPAYIADKLLSIGLEVESLTYLGQGINNIVTAKVVSIAAHPTSPRLNVCEIDIGSFSSSIDCVGGKDLISCCEIGAKQQNTKSTDCVGGTNKTLQIITAATNVKAGDIVCAALIGACLPSGKQILAADFKGVQSCGMLCGASELGIDKDILDLSNDCSHVFMNVSDNSIKATELKKTESVSGTNGSDWAGRNNEDGLLILPPDTKPGLDVKKVLGLDDYLLDIAVTANRGDCHSVYGIARELAAALKRKLKPLDLDYRTYKTADRKLNVRINDKALCSRYIGSLVDEVKIASSPLWIRRRLKACGHSCINNIVDITNYVLLEVGQPLHAFDENIIRDGITVRRAFTNEELMLLDGSVVKLSESMLVIADDKKPLALAGIMGGKDSGIHDTTKSVFLESARFARGNIRTTARTLGVKSDSSQRFEKGVDYDSPDIGRRRALSLIQRLAAGRITDVVIKDEIPQPEKKIIRTGFSKFKDILGIEIPQAFIKDILKRLDFGVNDAVSYSSKSDKNNTKKSGKILEVIVPAFREDVDNFTDLIEEAIRFYGYDKLTETALNCGGLAGAGISVRRANINKIESLCCAAGGYEINNYSFIPAKHLDMLNLSANDFLRQMIRIINPLSEEYAHMRTQLVSGMLETLRRNQSRQNGDFILFEIDNVFMCKSLPLTELPDEMLTLCMGFCHKKADFYSVKSFVRSLCDCFHLQYDFDVGTQKYLHPGKSADILINGKNAGSFGVVHPLAAENFGLTGDIYILHLNLSDFIDGPQKIIKFTPLPKFPFVERDLSLTLKEDAPAGGIINLIKNADSLVNDVTVFDVYSGSQIEKGHKSLALKVILQNREKTMTEQEINGIMDKIISKLNAFGVFLR